MFPNPNLDQGGHRALNLVSNNVIIWPFSISFITSLPCLFLAVTIPISQYRSSYYNVIHAKICRYGYISRLPTPCLCNSSYILLTCVVYMQNTKKKNRKILVICKGKGISVEKQLSMNAMKLQSHQKIRKSIKENRVMKNKH